MIAKKTKNALRKNVLKKMGMTSTKQLSSEIIEEGVPTQQEGGASKTSKA
jgi:DNA-binding CsgD family transcriptional regulator